MSRVFPLHIIIVAQSFVWHARVPPTRKKDDDDDDDDGKEGGDVVVALFFSPRFSSSSSSRLCAFTSSATTLDDDDDDDDPKREEVDGFSVFPQELPSNARDPSKDDFINDATSPPRTREQQLEYSKHESLRDWLGRQSRKRSVDEIVVLTGNIHRGSEILHNAVYNKGRDSITPSANDLVSEA